MKIILPGERPMSVNKFYSGMHWKTRKDEADRVHMLIRASLGRGFKRLAPIGKVNISITAFFKNRPYDSDNIFGKLYVDGLKGLVIPDDTPKFVGTVATRSETDKLNPRIEIDIDSEKNLIFVKDSDTGKL